MSYDLAVWEGERPTDDKSARRSFSNLYDRYLDGEIEEIGRASCRERVL